MEMKTYKHKTNGSTMTYKDGCMKVENLVIEGEPDLNYWEEVINKKIIFDTYCHGYYTQQSNGKWFYSTKEGNPLCDIEYTINESSIGEGRYLLEPKAVEKDYEILEIHYKSDNEDSIVEYSNGIAVKRNDNISIKNTCTLKELNKTDWEKYITITKVKRLTDDEI